MLRLAWRFILHALGQQTPVRVLRQAFFCLVLLSRLFHPAFFCRIFLSATAKTIWRAGCC